MNQEFERTFIVLSHEADLAEGCLSVGLTALRTATVADKRGFYSGFFNTTIAFERLMKLVVICDHMLDHNMDPPSKTDLINYGHDLSSLFESCEKIAVKHQVSAFEMPTRNSIEREILSHFTKFAKFTRYYNLDSLKNDSGDIDPLPEWSNIIDSVITADVPDKKLKKRLDETHAFHEAISDSAFNISHDMHGQSVDLLDALSGPVKQDIAAPYMMIRIFKLLMPVMKLLSALGTKGFYTRGPNDSGPHIPEFRETLVYFMTDSKALMRKKRWP